MKTISKIAVLALTLALAGALSACGSSSSSASSASASSASAASESASSASATASDASSSAAATSESAQAASESASAATETPDYYQNEYFGIAFELPEGWAFADSSDVENMNAQLKEIAEGSVDMIAQAPDSSASVVVTVEEGSENTAGQDAEAHLDAAVEDMLASVQGSNVTYVSNGVEIEFEGVDRSIPATITKISSDGAEVWIGQACAEVDGNYMNISIIGTSEEAVNQIVSCFRGAAQQEATEK